MTDQAGQCADGVRVCFGKDSRSFNISGGPDGAKGIWGATAALEVDGRLWYGTEATQAECRGLGPDGAVPRGAASSVMFAFDDAGFALTLTVGVSQDGCSAFLTSQVENRAQRPLSLGKCMLLCVGPAAGGVRLGEDPAATVFLDYRATQHQTRIRRASEGTGRHVTKVLLHLFNPTVPLALHTSFVTFDRANTEHLFVFSKESGIEEIRSYCDFGGYGLAPGKCIRSETLMVELRGNPFRSLESWADCVGAEYRPRIWPTTPAGWVGWSWVDPFNVEEYERVVLRNAAAITRRLAGFGVEYVWVSIGNLKDGLPGNWLEFNRDSFPGGVENLTKSLDRFGLKLGLWVAPFWICSHAEQRMNELRDSLLRKTDGTVLTTRSEWQYGIGAKMPRSKRPVCFALDGSHPKAVSFLRNVFEVCRRWGVRYYMIDFLEAGAGAVAGAHIYDGHHRADMLKGPETYRNALKAVRESAGSDTFLVASSGPTVHNVGLVDAVRTGNDYGEGRPLNPESYFYPATFVINSAAHWTSHMHATNNMAATYFTHRKLYLNDSGNVMTVDKPIPVNDAQISATIFGLCGGPMMIGDDIDRISAERLALIKKCLPRTDTVAFPVDLFDSLAPDYPKVFHLRVRKTWDEWDIVGIFNYDDETRREVVAFEKLGMGADQAYVAWEFWNEQYLGVARKCFTAIIPPRSARIYRFTAQRQHPWLVSTDMHTLQGQVEISECVWDSKSMKLSSIAVRPRGEVGNVFIRVPVGLRLVNPLNHWIAKDAREGVLIVRRELVFEGVPTAWDMTFARTAKSGQAGEQE